MLDLDGLFRSAGCEGSVSVLRLADGESVAYEPDRVRVMASLVKVPIALEFHSQVSERLLDAAAQVTLDPSTNTPGPAGISRFEHRARMSLRDLVYLMLTISDNAATDVVTDAVGIEAVSRRLVAIGCTSTVVVGNLRQLLDEFAVDIGFGDYAQLLAAQSGALGADARTRSIDPDLIERSRGVGRLGLQSDHRA